jgi:hypothetical protein
MAVIRGIQADDGGWSDGYKDYDKAKFKSTVFVYDENNEQIFYKGYEEGAATWDYVPQGSRISYKVDTGESDRVQLQLIMFDMQALMRAMDEEMNGLSNNQIALLESGDEAFAEQLFTMAVERKGGMQNFFVQVWSNVFETSSEGIGTGVVTLDKNWQESSYMFIAHYGYDADAESNPTNEVLFDWATIIVSVGLMVVGALLSIPTGGASLAISAVGYGILAYDVMLLAKAGLAWKFGQATINKHDERFPQFGFNHTYIINTMGEAGAEELNNEISDENHEIIKDLSIMHDVKGIATIGSIALVILALIKIRKGKS